jgi:hypothetical protein
MLLVAYEEPGFLIYIVVRIPGPKRETQATLRFATRSIPTAKTGPQGLKPRSFLAVVGPTKVVP